jgi:hypothetical protein
LNRFAEVSVARGNDTDVGLLKPRPGQPLTLILLQEAQEFRLRRWAYSLTSSRNKQALRAPTRFVRISTVAPPSMRRAHGQAIRIRAIVRHRSTVDRDEWTNLRDEP